MKKKEKIQVAIYNAVQLGKKVEMELEEERENVEIKETQRSRQLLSQIGEKGVKTQREMKEKDAEVNTLREQHAILDDGYEKIEMEQITCKRTNLHMCNNIEEV